MDIATRKRRSSMQDVADAITDRFAGAQGIADIFHKLLFSGDTTSATKAKVLAKMADYLAATSKQYGDRERLSGMSTERIESRLIQLLKKHNLVVPIQGIALDAAGDAQTKEEEATGFSGVGRPPEGHRESAPDGEGESAGDVDE